jgi:hypothetical protein
MQNQYKHQVDRAFGTYRSPDLSSAAASFVDQQRSFLGPQYAALLVNLDKLLAAGKVATELVFAAGPGPNYTGGSKAYAAVEFDMLNREHLVNLDERIYEVVAKALDMSVDRFLVDCPASWVREGRVTVAEPFEVRFARAL